MSLAERIDRLDERERRLLGLLGVVFVALLLVLVPAGVSGWLSRERAENQRLREALDAIQAARKTLAQRQETRDALRLKYATPAPPLAAYLGDKAKAAGVELPETQDRPSMPHGKRFEERSTRVTVRKAGMRSLLAFLEAVVKAPHPLSITRLTIKRRGGETDSWDAEVIVSAYDRKAEPTKSDRKDQDGEGAP